MFFAILVSVCTPAYAKENWEQSHPRRAEVNERLENEDQRIHQERKEGVISPAQATQLRSQDRQIRQEEHLMGEQNNGSLTHQEQKILNQQENKLGGEINSKENWEQSHPRRTEVNGRLENEDQRIYQERKEGTISPAQATQLRSQDRQIRQEERLMGEQNNGSLTQQEQKTLNQQENKLGKEIGR